MVGKYKDLTTALPAMIEVLGDKDSDVSKLMIVEMGCITIVKRVRV
jgi:hypothetical protein